jgi:hypothetical protein
MAQLEILPLAITMMAGPQIMSAILLVTGERPVRPSVAFLIGVAAAGSLGVTIAVGIASLLGDSVSLGNPDDGGSAGRIIQYVLVGLLVAFALRNWRNRETIEPPKWLGTLMDADWKMALKIGFLVIILMPSDIMVMLTVGMNLEHAGDSLAAALPFIGLTVLIAALPLIGYLLFRQRAVRAMPKARDWMTNNSWMVNIIVCVIFIVLIV